MAHKPTVPKSVNTPSYHVWTDALHARSLAAETNDKWDRGAYVRWAILSAWTAFESACADALDESRFGYRFKEDLNAAIKKRDLTKIDWESRNWQKILEIQQRRNDYTHLRVPQSRLFLEEKEAEESIQALRIGIIDVYERANKPRPNWVDADAMPGWKISGGFTVSVSTTLIHAGANEDDPNSIRIAYVYEGKDYVTEVLPLGTDPKPVVDKLLREISLPISAVRVYEGKTLIEETLTPLRRS